MPSALPISSLTAAGKLRKSRSKSRPNSVVSRQPPGRVASHLHHYPNSGIFQQPLGDVPPIELFERAYSIPKPGHGQAITSSTSDRKARAPLASTS
jgi:hypothetical protein